MVIIKKTQTSIMKVDLSILETGVKNVKNINNYIFGFDAIKELEPILNRIKNRSKKNGNTHNIIFFIDHFFINQKNSIINNAINENDLIFYVNSTIEPTTDYINKLIRKIKNKSIKKPIALVGIGGGTTLDTTKAISNLLTNPGKAEDYQGWDLVKNPGIYKIGIPTISGTGSEATRTCVMTNKKNGLKLGMNSDHTVFDFLILDPNLTKTVPNNQYFYTGMDSYIHCIESLSGYYRNSIGDSFSTETIRLCKKVFLSKDMKSDQNRSNLMVASYLGGCAIATSYVGLIHPFSAALSVVFGTHHCEANCIVMRGMKEFYPKYYDEFWKMVIKQKIHIPKGICKDISKDTFNKLIKSTIIHIKPLTNALGPNFREILTDEKIIQIFKKM